MHRTRTTIAVLAAALLLAAACSSGSGGSGSDNAGGSSGTAGGSGAAALPPCPLDALAKATQPVEVVVWHTLTAKPLETLEQVVADYNASQTKVKVRLESQGSSYEEIQRKFEAAVPTKDLPGMIAVDDTFTQIMADSGLVLPAQSCIQADNYDTSSLLPVAKSYYTIGGALYPVSAQPANILFFYNRDHFRKAGLDPDKPPQTLDELKAAAEKIKAAGITQTPFVHEFASWKTEFWLTGAGASVVDNDNGRGTGKTSKATMADNQTAKGLFDWFKGMQADGLLLPIPVAPGQINQYLALAQQKASMGVESSSAATSVEAFLKGNLKTDGLDGAGDLNATNVSGLDIGAGAFPGIQPGHKTQMGGGAWYIFNTNPPEVQAASWEFSKYLNSPEVQAKLLIGGSTLPYNTKANDLPQVKEFYAGSLSGKWLKIAADQLNDINTDFPGPVIGPYFQFREAMRKAQDGLMFGGLSSQQALDQAQKEIDDSLKQYADEGF